MNLSCPVTELNTLCSNNDEEIVARNVLKLMRNKNPIILTLGCDENTLGMLSDVSCQHIAELGLKEILDTLKIEPVADCHFYAAAVLSAIKEINLVKKYLWKDSDFVNCLCRLLNTAKQRKENIILRGFVASIVQGTLLGSTPSVYFERLAHSEIFELFLDIFQNRLDVVSEQTYEEMLMTLLLLCQNNKNCALRCKEIAMAATLLEFSDWEPLNEDLKEKAKIASRCINHMANEDELPDHKKLLLNKFSNHIHMKNKSFKRMETVVCSFCSRVETSGGKFKKCSRCRVALYCSKVCQKAHWKEGHSVICSPPSTTTNLTC